MINKQTNKMENSNQAQLEYLKEKFINLGIYNQQKKRFYSKSVTVLWCIYETYFGFEKTSKEIKKFK
jgi:hypothetical protein